MRFFWQSERFRAAMMEILNAEARALLTLHHECMRVKGNVDEQGREIVELDSGQVGMLAVEIVWNGRAVKVYFTAKPETVALNEASKVRFIELADLGSQESR